RRAVPPAPPTDTGWQRCVGRSRTPWGDLQVLVLRGELVAIGPAPPDPMLAPAKLVPAGEHAFRVESKDGFGPVGELFVFELDGAGRVARLRIGENYTFPVDAW